ncbi:MAG TPA: hypothetical protein VF691_16840, partial [Cytophagaceae bacterium]
MKINFVDGLIRMMWVRYISLKEMVLMLTLSGLILNTGSLYAQPCEPSSKPTPHMGGHISPEFTNCWNMINSEYGANYGSANMGNASGGHAMVFLGKDGWPREDKEHTVLVSLNPDQNPNLKVQIGDLFHCQYKGTLSQVTLASTDAIIINKVESNGLVTFDLKVVKLGAIYLKLKGRVSDIQIMRPGYSLNDPRMVTDECKEYLRGLQVVRLMGLSGANSNMERKWEHRTPTNAPFENNVYNGEDMRISEADNPFDERASNPWLSNSFKQGRCYPWEKAIDLCNYLNVDFYANVPVLVDPDYMHELAKLVKARLKPTLNLYIEIGNELWNTGGGGAFLGAPMLASAVYNMVIVDGDRTIMGDPSKGIGLETETVGTGKWWGGNLFKAYGAWRRWPSYRLKQFMDEFAKEFGFADQGGVGGRIRAVLAGQHAYGVGQDYWFIGREGVEFLDKQFGVGTSKKYLYGLAVANYFNVPNPPFIPEPADATQAQKDAINIQNLALIEEVKAWSVDKIFEELYKETNKRYGQFGAEGGCRTDANSNCEGNEFEDLLAYAKRSELRVIAYEGGHETNVQYMGKWIPLNNLTAAYNSPAMYEHTKYEMEKWYSWMGYDALFIKNGFSAQKNYGAGYAVAEKIGDLSPQYKAYREVMDNPAPSLTKERGGIIGAEKKSVLPGWQIASYTFREYQESKEAHYGGRRLDGVKGGSKDIYIIRNETGGNYGLRMRINWIEQNAKYNIFMDGKIIQTWDLGKFKPANDNENQKPRWSDTIKFNIPYGTHAIHFTKFDGEKPESSFRVWEFEYTLLNELPPAKPNVIYGDLIVCKGNTKAKYEVSPVDFSACEYQWDGLPPTASILRKTSTPATGQGSFKMFVDWGSTPNGVYDLTVKAKNQSKISPFPMLESEVRLFKVTVQTCGFELDKSPVCLNENVTYTPALDAGAVEYRWDLGENVSPKRAYINTTPQAVVGMYSKVGVVSVNLVTKNAAGEEKVYHNTVNVRSCYSPYVDGPYRYCVGSTPLPLTAEATPGGTNLKWYTVPEGGTGSSTPPTISTATADTISYYVSQINGGVESIRSQIDVIIYEGPSAPIVTAAPPLCVGQGSTVTDLTNRVIYRGGAKLKWYTSNSATVSTDYPTAVSTDAPGNFSWFISQVQGTCESAKAELKVSVVGGAVFKTAASDPACSDKGKITISGLNPNTPYRVSYPWITPLALTSTSEGKIILDVAPGTYRDVKVDNYICLSLESEVEDLIIGPSTSKLPYTVVARQPKTCGGLGAIVLKGLQLNTAYKISYNDVPEQNLTSQGDSI